MASLDNHACEVNRRNLQRKIITMTAVGKLFEMGNCVSCNGGSTNEQVELHESRNDARNSELQVPNCIISSGISMRTDYSTACRLDNVNLMNGSSSNQHVTLDSPALASQKSDKKAFYSRIPPLGRVGSADKDKKSLINASITDNNNAYSEIKISALFEHYKDPHEDTILAEGIERLCRDLELKPEDFRVLVLAWKFGAEQMCRFTRVEFYRGMRALKTDSIQGVRAVLAAIAHDVQNDSTQFKDLYRFAFKFGLDSDLGQRILPIDMAISLWRVVFWAREPPVLERWFNFLEAHPLIRGIPRDTWNMFLNFVETVGTDLSSYDDTEAWPSLFDDFVEYENDQLNQNITTSRETNFSLASKDQQQPLNNSQLNIIDIESQQPQFCDNSCSQP
ncbi:unnamed protein product [Allacma fusca]|uniref:Defective in cullin neddylation protein n=1 Tax=Allacma fusca TaxID=39272 RepID=A0A8J2K359_9HEXA|nr:unnamed protein product [Allacma fusca]